MYVALHVAVKVIDYRMGIVIRRKGLTRPKAKGLVFRFLAFSSFSISSAAFSLYPLVLPAVNPANSLTIQNASASEYGLTVGLIWWTIGIILAAIYFILTYRLFWGKVNVKDTEGY